MLRAVPRLRADAPSSDAQLVEAARRGDAFSAEILVRRHVRAVNGLALRLLGRDGDVDDVVQDSFAAAFGALDRLQDPQAFEAWICGILVRTVGKAIRRRRMLARLGLGRALLAIDLDALIAPSVPQDEALELRRLYALAERLPAALRIPLLLQRVEGLGLVEIAKLTGASLATVKRRITTAEVALRDSFLRGEGR
ncbi:MAG TPA: RNA polymerase sigma factor [Polyangia bacterium]|jgi:RNA polymerase sigma-70 factor (ECF subfamily)|nr:RNA polymerase sigma factor [Polyangia bacterium]